MAREPAAEDARSSLWTLIETVAPASAIAASAAFVICVSFNIGYFVYLRHPMGTFLQPVDLIAGSIVLVPVTLAMLPVWLLLPWRFLVDAGRHYGWRDNTLEFAIAALVAAVMAAGFTLCLLLAPRRIILMFLFVLAGSIALLRVALHLYGATPRHATMNRGIAMGMLCLVFSVHGGVMVAHYHMHSDRYADTVEFKEGPSMTGVRVAREFGSYAIIVTRDGGVIQVWLDSIKRIHRAAG
ncbi:MAG TPA: hypothetical protein VGM87_00740 [Roseomonas sp.]|jgi:hypothetical protein